MFSVMAVENPFKMSNLIFLIWPYMGVRSKRLQIRNRKSLFQNGVISRTRTKIFMRLFSVNTAHCAFGTYKAQREIQSSK